ncbi:MAG: ABC transporter permease [Chloroflexi bacterium]|nr:ABC transporter permease [Chloroflexota bacterium]
MYHRLAPPAYALVALILLWYLALFISRTPDFILPYPDRIVVAFFKDAGLLYRHTIVTLQEIGLGLAIGIAIGLMGALSLVWSRTLETAVLPWVFLLESTPKIVIAPLLVIWFGFGITTKILVVTLLVFFPVLVTTIAGLKSVETDMLDLIQSMGASRWQVFSKARLPTALPSFFSGLKLSAALATIGAVVGEWMGADAGLGYLLLSAYDSFATPLLFAIIVLLAMIGTLLYQAAALCERLMLPWHASLRQESTIAM